ncbi:hypothetical protein HMI54_008557 [Coelomomyces lativittatus]|nr:hypothetical protein HMI54_008557 [Coelomomyces lativittatus]
MDSFNIEFEFYQRWFDVIFLFSALSSIAVLYFLHTSVFSEPPLLDYDSPLHSIVVSESYLDPLEISQSDVLRPTWLHARDE